MMGEPWTEVLHSQRAKKVGLPSDDSFSVPNWTISCASPLSISTLYDANKTWPFRRSNCSGLGRCSLVLNLVSRLAWEQAASTERIKFLALLNHLKSIFLSWACSVYAFSCGLARRPSGRSQGWRFLPQVATLMRLTRSASTSVQETNVVKTKTGTSNPCSMQ